MGRKGKWLVSVKRVFSPKSKEKRGQKSKRRWVFCSNSFDPESLEDASNDEPHLPSKPARLEDVKLAEAENEPSKRAYSAALATAVAAEAAAVAAKAAAEVARLTASTRFSGRSREEIAAIKIQSAFRGYLARRVFQAMRGLFRLKSLVHGNAIQRQTTNALRCMQTLARVQSQVRSRRIKLTEENQALQRQLQLKHERELEKIRMGAEWNVSLQSKERSEANLLNKHEAAVRRERALAYAFSHQWKNSSRSMNPTFMDPENPQWGWSWMERWMAARPWESRHFPESDRASSRSTTRRSSSRRSSFTVPSKRASDDSQSTLSLRSDRCRRHSMHGSSVRDDESLASSPSVPSYMAPTQATKLRSRFQSPSSEKGESPTSRSAGSARKRLSFPVGEKGIGLYPVGARRHSGPPKMGVASLK